MPRLFRARGAAAAVLGVVPALGSFATPADAAPPPIPTDGIDLDVGTATNAPPESPTSAAPHCSTTVIPPAEFRAGVRNSIKCFATVDEALADAAGTLASRASVTSADGGGFDSPNAGPWVLATHYDTTDTQTSESFSVVGYDCDGGMITLGGSSWNDRISLTKHGMCGSVKHYANVDGSGASQMTQQPNGYCQSLNGTMTNQSSAITYGGAVQ